jgi:hypothetical protein
MAEVPVATIGRARVFVDQRAAAWSEAGDLINARAAHVLTEDGTTEIGAVLAGMATGRTDPQESPFFKSVGNAVQDVAVAQRQAWEDYALVVSAWNGAIRSQPSAIGATLARYLDYLLLAYDLVSDRPLETAVGELHALAVNIIGA